MINQAGQFKKQLSGESAYYSFLPTPLQELALDEPDSELYSLLVKAHQGLSKLESLADHIPDLDLFIGMYVRKEALLSSQIEGTQATLDDILDPQAPENQNLQVAEVLNYVKAVNYALKRVESLPLCNRLLREAHELLLSGIRGGEKNPGEFRTSQNWIGGQGSSIKNASYIPPSPEDMIEAMSDLEKYINDEANPLDPLLQIALIHYQFETIHPFLDGNGRIGRLLIILFMLERGLLSRPVFYISYYLKMQRVEYYDRLSQVRKKGNFHQWLVFFQEAIIETAKDAIETIEKLKALRARSLAKIGTLGKAKNRAKLVYDYVESSPIIEISKTSTALGMAYNTVSQAVADLVQLGVLEHTENAKRNRVFAYEEYLAILRKDTQII